MAHAVAVGIDLGTTNSAAAWVEPSGRTAMLRNSEGDMVTPSAVFFDDSEVVVGKEARRVAALYPDRVALWVKRDMGSPVYSRPIRGEHLPPEVIQACILRKFKADIFGSLGPAAKVVLTVPAYFDEPRRKATADAGEMAGLTLLDIVNEPTAAALAFGETLGYLSPGGKPLEEMNVMIYDLGGGTFDATLLRLAPGDVRTLATDGDVQLGGHDWDSRLVRLAAESFQQSHGRDPREDPAALNRLYDAVVEAKHTLSVRSRAAIRVDFAGTSCEVPVTREQFEELTADLLERTAYTSRQLLAAGGLSWNNVSRILLVGGSTRMPMVARMLQQVTGIVPDRSVNPDEAVARGAALYAYHLLASPEQGGSGSTFAVTNVNSHSLGVEGIDPATFRRINVVLIPRNTPLPVRFTEKFTTKSDGQRSTVIQVLEGESTLPGECTAIGRTVIRDLPLGLPKGWPVEVTFEYGANGRLSVHGVVPGTHRQVTLELERDVGLSREGISRWKQTVGAGAGFDRFEAMLQDVLNLPVASPGAGAHAAADGLASPGGRWDIGPQGQPPGAATAVLPQPPPESTAASPPAVVIQSQPTPLFVHSVPGTPQPESGGPKGEGDAQLSFSLGPGKAAVPAAGAVPEALPVVFEPLGGTGGEPGHRPVPARPFSSQPADQGGVPRWLISIVAYSISAVAGIGLGYLVISLLLPGARLPKLW